VSMDVVASLITTGSKPSAGDAPGKRGGSAVASTAPAAARAPVHSKPTVRPTQETLAVIAKQIDSYLRSIDRSLQFTVDDASGRMVISVRDASGNLVRQIPGEEALRLAACQCGGATLLDMTV
jgi:flagellar protein FlaG